MKRRPQFAKSISGFALIDAVMMLIIISLSGAAALSYWAVASQSSTAALESGAGYAAAKSALDAARSQGEAACSASAIATECSLANGGLPPELSSAGWASTVTARTVDFAPAEAGSSSTNGQMVLYEAVVISAMGNTWTLSATQLRATP